MQHCKFVRSHPRRSLAISVIILVLLHLAFSHVNGSDGPVSLSSMTCWDRVSVSAYSRVSNPWWDIYVKPANHSCGLFCLRGVFSRAFARRNRTHATCILSRVLVIWLFLLVSEFTMALMLTSLSVRCHWCLGVKVMARLSFADVVFRLMMVWVFLCIDLDGLPGLCCWMHHRRLSVFVLRLSSVVTDLIVSFVSPIQS
jgi:hypothetical protein